MEKVGRIRCTRCRRIIKNGKAEYLFNLPFGENCAKITRNMEIAFRENELVGKQVERECITANQSP